MNYSEMVHSIHLATRIPKTKVDAVLRRFFTEVESVAMSGEPVTLRLFGRFVRKPLKPKKMFGRVTKPRNVLRFKPRRSSG